MRCSNLKALLHDAEIESYTRALALYHDGKISYEYFQANWNFQALCQNCQRERGEDKWPDGDRLKVAMNLSPDPETCADLLGGQYVDPVRLDPEWLRWAKREQFVALKPALETLVA